MKSTSKILMGVALIGMLFLNSCGSDDNAPPTPNASDITVTIDENPAGGLSIGIVTTNITGTLAYSLSSQSASNALNIDATTGAVTVNDAAVFDFETNPSVTAVVSVTNSTDTATSNVTVTLNDVDDIASFLTTSEAAYTSAVDGDWIQITSAEYDALAMSLNTTFRSGTTEGEYSNPSATLSAGTGLYTITNSQQPPMPDGSLVFAFRYSTTNITGIAGNKVKVSSTSVMSGFMDLGIALPTHDGVNNDVFFVLKGSNTPTTAAGYIAIMMASGNNMGYKVLTGNDTYNVGFADTGDLPTNDTGAKFLFQGLSSTQKQWD